jgi:hypothetical protein
MLTNLSSGLISETSSLKERDRDFEGRDSLGPLNHSPSSLPASLVKEAEPVFQRVRVRIFSVVSDR